MTPVFAETTPHGKELQRALLQWFRPDKKTLVIEALKKAGREDLIGYGPKCLVRPYGDDRAMPHGKSGGGKKPSAAQTGGRRNDAPRGGQSPKNSGADKPKTLSANPAGLSKAHGKESKEIKMLASDRFTGIFLYRSYIHLPGDEKSPWVCKIHGLFDEMNQYPLTDNRSAGTST